MNIELTPEIIRNASIVDLNNRFSKSQHEPLLALDRDAIERMIQNILTTEKGTYPFEPTFGVDLERYLYKNITESVLSEVESVVLSALNQWMPYVRISPNDVVAYKEGSTSIIIEIYAETKLGKRETFAFRISRN